MVYNKITGKDIKNPTLISLEDRLIYRVDELEACVNLINKIKDKISSDTEDTFARDLYNNLRVYSLPKNDQRFFDKCCEISDFNVTREFIEKSIELNY